jgi:hypothetical protein
MVTRKSWTSHSCHFYTLSCKRARGQVRASEGARKEKDRVRQEIRSKGAREKESKRDDKEAVHKLPDRQDAAHKGEANKEAASACKYLVCEGERVREGGRERKSAHERERERGGGGGGGGREGGREGEKEGRERKRDRTREEREERVREGEGGSQGGRNESHAWTVLQPAEDKMRKTLDLSVFPAQNSRGHVDRSSQVRLAGCFALVCVSICELLHAPSC